MKATEDYDNNLNLQNREKIWYDLYQIKNVVKLIIFFIN